MAKHRINPLLTLQLRKTEILAELEAKDQARVAELRLIDQDISALSKGLDSVYAGISGSRKAVDACLTRQARFMEKEEIVDQLFRGGFDLDPANGKRLLIELIKKHVQRGNYQEDWDGKVGLLNFANPQPMTPERKEYLRTRKSKT